MGYLSYVDIITCIISIIIGNFKSNSKNPVTNLFQNYALSKKIMTFKH